jgi:NADH-quinone oxidoreductase subunit G
MDADIFTQTPAVASADFARLQQRSVKASFTESDAVKDGPGAGVPQGHSTDRKVGDGQVVLATWRQLLDNGSLQVDEPHLAGTARPAVARLSAPTANGYQWVTVSTDRGSITLPVEVSDLPDGVVWLPANSDGSNVRAALGAGHGAVVSISGGEQ